MSDSIFTPGGWAEKAFRPRIDEQIAAMANDADSDPLAAALSESSRLRERADVRREALLEAANEVHIEARWQEEQRVRGLKANESIDRLLMLEEVLRDRAMGTT